MGNAPHFDIDPAEFWRDPYPTLARMRDEAPVAYVPQLGATVLTRRDDITVSEKQVDIFSSHQPDGLMNKLMGHNLMRKDGEDHLAERKTIFPSVSPRTVRQVWQDRFESHTARILRDLAPLGEADLFDAYARPVSGEALKEITGLTNITYEQMDAFSQAMIDGIANYAGDPEVEARCHEATAGIDAAIDEMIPKLSAKPDKSLLSVMLEADLPMESTRANVKLAISGGQNEPRDAIAGTIWALMTHPEQLEMVLSGEVSWLQAFEEYARWISPIGMSPRRIAKHHTIGGVELHPEDRVFLLFGSANRDEDHFKHPERFDVTRDASKSIAFGAGPHFCAGAAASRSLIAEVALPAIFGALKHLRLDRREEVRLGGWAFRGVLNLPVLWDTA
ncbi:MAG: cytochrome P450 [Pseudomonadota bacterium]